MEVCAIVSATPSDNEPRDLTALVTAARKGDLAAYGEIVRRTQPQVLAAARAILHHEQDAEDAAQEAYLRAYGRLGELRDPQAATAWLMQIARRCAHDSLRRRRSTSSVEAAGDRHEGDASSLEQSQALARAMVNLPPADRRLFERYYLGGHTTAKIAAQVGLTDAAVRKRLERLRQRMRKEIAMSREATPADLPQRIIDLLARPILTDLPENPVGAVWDDIRASLPDYQEQTLPEKVRFDDAARLYGPEIHDHIRRELHVIDAEHFLRGDLTLPMVIALKGQPVGTRWCATGKVYRNQGVDALHLEAFHQVEAIMVGERLDGWAMMDWTMSILQRLLGKGAVQLEPLAPTGGAIGGICTWDLAVRWADRWATVAAFGAASNSIVRTLGHDAAHVSIVGVCFGLERLASLRYGIDDIRKVEAARVTDD